MPATSLDAGFEYYLIVLHPAENCVLFLREPHRLTLPAFASREPDLRAVRHINQAAQRLTGMPTAALRCIATRYQTAVSGKRYFALQALTEIATPDNATWLTEAQINDRASIPPYQKAILREWFLLGQTPSTQRPAWEQPGWFARASASMVDIADRLDLVPRGPVIQQTLWSRACQLHLATSGGDLALKAVPPLFSYEPVLTRVLSLRYPHRVPEVLAVNVEQAWMLTREGRGSPLAQLRTLDVWKSVLRQFAEIQIDLSENTHSLVAVGLPDRNVDYLVSQIDRLMIDLPPVLEDDEKQALRRAALAVKMLCYELVEYRLPLSITHGDLWSEHIRVLESGTAQFANWSDSCVSHPFFDIPIFLADIENELPQVPDVRQQLLQTYLEMWTKYEPMFRLRKACAIAEVVSKLQQVINYHQFILPAVEPTARQDMQHIIPSFLRQLLFALRTYSG